MEIKKFHILQHTLPILFRLQDFQSTNSSFELLLKVLSADYSTEMKNHIFLNYLKDTISENISNFAGFIDFMYENKLVNTLKEVYGIKRVSRYSKNILSDAFTFMNHDYIINIYNVIDSYITVMKRCKFSPTAIEVNFFKDLLEGVININENDSQYSAYMEQKSTGGGYGEQLADWLNTVVSRINEIEKRCK